MNPVVKEYKRLASVTDARGGANDVSATALTVTDLVGVSSIPVLIREVTHVFSS